MPTVAIFYKKTYVFTISILFIHVLLAYPTAISRNSWSR